MKKNKLINFFFLFYFFFHKAEKLQMQEKKGKKVTENFFLIREPRMMAIYMRTVEQSMVVLREHTAVALALRDGSFSDNATVLWHWDSVAQLFRRQTVSVRPSFVLMLMLLHAEY